MAIRQRNATLIAVFMMIAFSAPVLAQKGRRNIPLAPPPAKILAAKKVFVVNGGGNDLAYDALYSAVKGWGRYEIVDTSTAADIVMEIRYVTEDKGNPCLEYDERIKRCYTGAQQGDR